MLTQAFLFFCMIIVRSCYVFLSYKNRRNDRTIHHILDLIAHVYVASGKMDIRQYLHFYPA